MARRPLHQGPKVTAVPLESRSLVTWGPEHAVWGDGKTIVSPPEGTIVRLKPAALTSDNAIAWAVATLKKNGCYVRLLPRPKRDTLAKAPERLAKALTPRKTVEALLKEQEATAELVGLVRSVMDAEGL